MGIPTPEELKHKITISWGLAVAYTVVLVSTSFSVSRMLDNDQQREDLKAHYDQQIRELKEFLLAEISGHRSDCDRRYYEVIDQRLKKMEK